MSQNVITSTCCFLVEIFLTNQTCMLYRRRALYARALGKYQPNNATMLLEKEFTHESQVSLDSFTEIHFLGASLVGFPNTLKLA